MKPYAVDSNERVRVAFWLAAISIFLSFIFSILIGLLIAWLFEAIQGPCKYAISWLLVAPSAGGIYLALHKIFDKKCWRWPILRKIKFVEVPDLNGTWLGSGKSSRTELKEEFKIDECVIKQTWTKISIYYDFPKSTSYSLIAGFIKGTHDNWELAYEYENRPKVDTADPDMRIHRGTSRFDIRIEKKPVELVGEYYSGQHRRRYGVITLRKSE